MIHFFLPGDESHLFDDYLHRSGEKLGGCLVAAPIESLPHRRTFPAGTWVLSGLDRLGPASLRHLGVLADAAIAQGVRVLNHPARTLRRYDLLAELHRLSFNDFRAWRLDEVRSAAVKFPLFLRDEATHEGSLTPLLRSRFEVAVFTALLTATGYDRSRLIAVEYRDASSPDGGFRKYSAFIVADRIIAKDLAIGHAWTVKREESSWTLGEMEEELAFVLSNPHQEMLRKIFAAARTDYGRIDYSMAGDRLLTWEINLYPTMARSRTAPERRLAPEVASVRVRSTTHFHGLFVDAWRDVDSPDDREISIDVAPDIVAAARAEKPVRRRVDRFRNAVAPLRPMIRPIKALGLSFAARVDRMRGASQRRSHEDVEPGARPK